MPELAQKYYVWSGKLNYVLLSTNVEKAAIRFAQISFQPSLKGQLSANSVYSMINEQAFSETVSRMGPKVLVSESGFNNSKVGVFETSEVVACYREQMRSLESLVRKIL